MEAKKMMKAVLLSAALVIGGASITGCSDSVDKQKLVQLTGDKSFEEIKKAWQMSILQEKPDEAKIYAYWLKENGQKASPTFNFENFKTAFMTKYNEDISKIKKRMEAIKKDVDEEVESAEKSHREPGYRLYKALREEATMAGFQSFTSAFIRNTYIPFLEKQMKRISEKQKKIKNHIQEHFVLL